MPVASEIVERERVRSILDAFHAVYNYFAFGFLESVYATALEYELVDRGHSVTREAMVDVYYKSRLASRQRIDMIVDAVVMLEIKATESIADSSKRQLLGYLCATPIQVGLLLHFGPRPRFFRYVQTTKRYSAAMSAARMD
jgi:GxxExxY protein